MASTKSETYDRARGLAAAVRHFVRGQRSLSYAFDRAVLPPRFLVEGYSDFRDRMVPAYIRSGMLVFDVGGGKTPFFSREEKQRLALSVVGLDISASELDSAPSGAYDETVAADITAYEGRGQADIVVSAAMLEHVVDVAAALRAMKSIVKPGGLLLGYVPGRNATYTVINRLLPESVKRAVLFSLFPETRTTQGFPAFYDRCTPQEFHHLAAQLDLEVVELRVYFRNDYFTFLFPLHLAWRLWLLLFMRFAGEQAAESFCFAMRRR